MTKIIVVGSISMDYVVSTQKRPAVGETVLGHSFVTVPGGKGANQAIAAARLGAEVVMVGCVGKDEAGTSLKKNLSDNHVNVTYVKQVEQSTGSAHIVLSERDNSIIVVQGANELVNQEAVHHAIEEIKTADMVMLQLEIPLETVEYVVALCKELGVPVLLNPAPSRHLPTKILDDVRYITPNSTEVNELCELEKQLLLQKYPHKLIVTEGKNGVRYFDGKEEQIVPSFQVKAIDTTGAGDTFNGAFAVAIANGRPIEESLMFANAAAALSVTKFGAQGGIPSLEEVEIFVNNY